ncbi:MAG: mechanosensitive ion channel [Candidatus Omnitrophica bacterium]|nr:mechanosensitive ion channel [Candidatus Omnitrophota bacterium]
MQEVINKVYEYVIQYGMNVIGAIVIFIIGRLIAKVVVKLIEEAMVRAKIDKTLASFARHLGFYGIMTFVIIAALNKLGVETSSFIAVVGAASLAVGFALQGSLANFASGVMLILFQPFHVGDKIEAGGAVGIVHEIQIFNTVIIAEDNKRVIVPNAKITGDKIVVYP